MGLDALFDELLLPLLKEAGAIIFKITLINGIYVLIRGNASSAIKTIKTSTIGYFLLESISTYVKLIDQIADRIQF